MSYPWASSYLPRAFTMPFPSGSEWVRCSVLSCIYSFVPRHFPVGSHTFRQAFLRLFRYTQPHTLLPAFPVLSPMGPRWVVSNVPGAWVSLCVSSSVTSFVPCTFPRTFTLGFACVFSVPLRFSMGSHWVSACVPSCISWCDPPCVTRASPCAFLRVFRYAQPRVTSIGFRSLTLTLTHTIPCIYYGFFPRVFACSLSFFYCFFFNIVVFTQITKFTLKVICDLRSEFPI